MALVILSISIPTVLFMYTINVYILATNSRPAIWNLIFFWPKYCWTLLLSVGDNDNALLLAKVAKETSNVDSDHGDGNNDENVPSLRIVNVDSLFVCMKVKMVTVSNFIYRLWILSFQWQHQESCISKNWQIQIAWRGHRGHPFKLTVPISRCNRSKYFFSSRIVSVWNCLPAEVVMAKSIHSFKTEVRKVDISKFLILPCIICWLWLMIEL